MNESTFVAPTLVFTVTGAATWCARPLVVSATVTAERTGETLEASDTPEARPRAAILASSARRRATPLELAVAEVAGALLADLSPDERARVRIVLGSRFGELSATHIILGSLTSGDGRVSPTAFSSSVHNASLGLVSIAQAIHAGTVAMSGGAATAYLSIVEAAGLLHEADAPVLVVLADELPQPELGQHGAFPSAAIALRLERARARRFAAQTTTCVVMPRAGEASSSSALTPSSTGLTVGRSTAAPVEADAEVVASLGVDTRLVDVSPAWWPLRRVVAGLREDAHDEGGVDGVGVREILPLVGGAPVTLPMGTRGDGAAELRIVPSDEHDGVAAAYDAMPHETPARVVGFPAWRITDGLVCTVSPTQGDPFVQPRRASPDDRKQGGADEYSAGAGAGSGASVVDAVGCLEWIAQAAAWCGCLDGVATDPTEREASSPPASGGALLATRCFHVHQRWLPLGVAYRVNVQRVVHGEGVARYEGVVTSEHGRVVASGDILVRSSSR